MGATNSAQAARNFNALVSCDLGTGKWEVESGNDEEPSWEAPVPTQNAQMWAVDGKIYVLGGRTAMNRLYQVDDYTLQDEQDFWSYALGSRAWHNEGVMPSRAATTNTPSGGCCGLAGVRGLRSLLC
jgi:hypothetical protein